MDNLPQDGIGLMLLVFVLGVLNLFALVGARADEPVRLTGIKSAFVARVAQTAHPLLIALVGSIFAVSFDTLSQAALFAMTAAQFGGIAHALALGALFTLGMLLVDGCNGVWLFHLIHRANRQTEIASRVFAAVISALSFAVGLFGVARYFSPAVSQWSEDREFPIGLAVILLVILGFLLAMGVAKLKPAKA